MPRQILADVYLSDGGNPNRSYITYPGGRIDFRGNHAVIVDERDVVPVLRMPNVVVHISAERVDWAQKWIDDCGLYPAKAEVVIPTKETSPSSPDNQAVEPAGQLHAEPEPAIRQPWAKPKLEQGVETHKLDCECLFCARVRKNRHENPRSQP